MYEWPTYYVYGLNSQFVYLGNNRDTSVIHEKAKLVCFIYMHSDKVKFEYVQINMKQVP